MLTTQCLAQVNVSTQLTYWNDHIDFKSKNQIKLLDDEVIASFNQGNTQKLISLFSDTLKKITGNSIPGFMDQVHPLITGLSYDLLDEYFVKSSGTGGSATVFKSMSEDNDYKINYPIVTKETYISLIVYKGPIRQFLFTCIYGKYGENWKLNALRMGPYKIFGKNSVDLYKQSKEYFNQGDLMDAKIYILLAQETSLPANKAFVYFKLDEMMAFNQKLSEEGKAKFPLPMNITQVSTSPQIFSVEPVVLKEGIFPSVKYLTTVPLKDTTALKVENEEIKKVIGEVFPGIDKNKKYVFFKAYNQIPNSKNAVPTYGFMLKQKEN
ncbi:MAG TPA: hypothetical protein VK668_02140 [Mucilaginibacter sp.]|nr:hypothetical protein [Mucilaginibacter sp.]